MMMRDEMNRAERNNDEQRRAHQPTVYYISNENSRNPDDPAPGRRDNNPTLSARPTPSSINAPVNSNPIVDDLPPSYQEAVNNLPIYYV